MLSLSFSLVKQITLYLRLKHLRFPAVSEEQEVSIEYVVDNVVKSLERNRTKLNDRAKDGEKLPPFKIAIEVCNASV
jgi:ribosome-associated translation inhibitor RaiA